MSRTFMKLFAAALLLSTITLSAHAQEDAPIRPLTKSGSAAFIFNIAGLGAFGPTAQVIGTVSNGTNSQPVAGLGMKYYFADDMAGKVLLAFGTTDNGGKDAALVTSSQLGIGAIFEYHLRDFYSTSPYLGGGVMFATGSTTTGTSTNEVKNKGSQLTVMAVAGFDWFFTKGIAIGLEWGLGYTSNSSSTTVAGNSTDGLSPNSIGIGFTGTSAGISGSGGVHAIVYF